MPSGILLPVKGMLETLENSSIGMLDYLMLVVIQTMKLHVHMVKLLRFCYDQLSLAICSLEFPY